MAACDYRLCDVCHRKTFYDSNLNYDSGNEVVGSVRNAGRLMANTKLDYLGDWAVICNDCAATHECIVAKKSTLPAAEPADAGRDIALDMRVLLSAGEFPSKPVSNVQLADWIKRLEARPPSEAAADGNLRPYALRNLRALIEGGSTDKALMLKNLEVLQ